MQQSWKTSAASGCTSQDSWVSGAQPEHNMIVLDAKRAASAARADFRVTAIFGSILIRSGTAPGNGGD